MTTIQVINLRLDELDQKIKDLNKEIREFQGEGKIALEVEDIMERYHVGRARAYDIIRGIRSVCGGGKLGEGKVLPTEARYWESLVETRKVRL